MIWRNGRWRPLELLSALLILVGLGVLVYVGVRTFGPALSSAPTSAPTSTSTTTTSPDPSLEDLDIGLPVERLPDPLPPELAAEVRPLRLTPVVDGLLLPTAAIAEPDTDRWYVLEKEGRVRRVVGARLEPEPVLDLSDRVVSEGEAGERGLVGIALHPSFDANRRVFLSYTDLNGDLVIVEHRAGADGATFESEPVAEILRVPQPGTTHHGGRLLFGPEGYLWIGLGDGGLGAIPDPHGHAQNPATLLGSLLRIDVDLVSRAADGTRRAYSVPSDNPFADSDDRAPEVWAYGLRNPWAFTIDEGVLYLADVGHVTSEEINILPVIESRGANFGWGFFEGPYCHQPDRCAEIDAFHPTLGLLRPGLCAVIGGRVYRGSVTPWLVGRYVYSDYCTGAISTVLYEDGEVREHLDWRDHTGGGYNITDIFEDGFGEIHVIHRFGLILRLGPVG